MQHLIKTAKVRRPIFVPILISILIALGWIWPGPAESVEQRSERNQTNSLSDLHTHPLDDCRQRFDVHASVLACENHDPNNFECIPNSGGECTCQHPSLTGFTATLTSFTTTGSPEESIRVLMEIHSQVNRRGLTDSLLTPRSILRREVHFFANLLAAYKGNPVRMDPNLVKAALQNVWNGRDPFNPAQTLKPVEYTAKPIIDPLPMPLDNIHSHEHSGSGCTRTHNAECTRQTLPGTGHRPIPDNGFFDCAEIPGSGAERMWRCVHSTVPVYTSPLRDPRQNLEEVIRAYNYADSVDPGSLKYVDALSRQAWLVWHLTAARPGVGPGWMRQSDRSAAKMAWAMLIRGSDHSDDSL